MKMKKELSMLATVAAMASAGVAKGENALMRDVFNAPIDQILRVSDDYIVTYRPEAHHVFEKDGQVTTNYYPTVAQSVDGKQGFAFKGPKTGSSALLVNSETGKFVVGAAEGDNDAEFYVGTMNNGSAVNGVSMEKFRMIQVDTNSQVQQYKVVGAVGYMYDDDRVILFRKATTLTGTKTIAERALRVGDKTFQYTDKKTLGCETPKMATHTSTEVFTSDGTQISAYKKDAYSTTVTPVVSGKEIKGMTVVDDTLVYATSEGIHNRQNKELASMTGIVGMAKVGSTLYVATTNSANNAQFTVKSNDLSVNIQPVYDAKQIVAGKESGQDALWKLALNNQLQRVKD